MSGIRQQQPHQGHQHEPVALAQARAAAAATEPHSMGRTHAEPIAAAAEHIRPDKEDHSSAESQTPQPPPTTTTAATTTKPMGQRIQRAQQPLVPAAADSPLKQTGAGIATLETSQKGQQTKISDQPQQETVNKQKKRAAKLRKNQQQQQQPPPPADHDYYCYNDTQESNVQFRTNNNNNNNDLGQPPPARCSSQASGGRIMNNSPITTTTTTVQRPRSAMAGTATSGAGAHKDSPSIGALARQGQSMTTMNQRARTTRVRINSTSEQIKDPNWLIRMSQELEMQQRQGKRGHLKALHRKLKSTLANTITGGGASSDSSSVSAVVTSGGGGGAGGDPQSVNAYASVPATPTKTPVSILKQRNHSTCSASSLATPPNFGVAVKSPAKRSTVPQSKTSSMSRPASTRPARGDARKNPPTSSAQDPTSPSPTRINSAATATATTTTTASTTASLTASAADNHQGSEQVATTTTTSSATIKPICADGQVKVSGWKRNNLLAKTLSHFDEIRGNQRPVFVPTKIKLPPDVSAAMAAAHPAAQQRQQTKFAEIVREAVSKKNLLASPAATPALASRPSSSQDNPSAICNLLLQQQHHHHHQQQQRTSMISADGQSDQDASCAGDAAHRSVSADGSGLLAGQQQQQQPSPPQMRPSSAASSPNSSGRFQHFPAAGSLSQMSPISKHQTPQSRASSRQGGAQTPLGQQQQQLAASAAQNQLLNQLLLNSSAQQALSSYDSSRQFKLQLKNNQVLQNLRRQSNELQAQLQQAAASAISESESNHQHQQQPQQQQQHQSSHLKDWKRLAGKLSLLTSGGRHAAAVVNNRNLLSVLGSAPTTSGGSQLQPLRLTVSNEEQSSSANSNPNLTFATGQQPRRGNSQQQLQLPQVGSADTAQESQQRKLSSSSMVVQPVSSKQQHQQQHQHQQKQHHQHEAGPSQSSLSAHPADPSRPPRRRSDSEAYRIPQVTNPGNQESPFDDQPVKPAIVVNRNDLLQLLQVTCGSSSSNNNNNNDPINSPAGISEILRASSGQLRTQSDSAVSPTISERPSLSAFLAATGAATSSKSVETLAISSNQNIFDSDGENNRSDISKQRDSGSEMAGCLLPADDEGSQTALFANSTLLGAGCDSLTTAAGLANSPECQRSAQQQRQQQQQQQQADKGGRADLSWVVKQTSKVAFFQHKLRKMRWHSKQQQQQKQHQLQQQQQQTLSSCSGGSEMDEDKRGTALAKKGKHAGGESELSSSSSNLLSQQEVKEQQQQQQKTSGELSTTKSGDVFMDPELIGDAIEIFLRSTMQNNSGGAGKHADENDDDDDDDGDDDDDDTDQRDNISGSDNRSDEEDQRGKAPTATLTMEGDGRAGGLSERVVEASQQQQQRSSKLLACGSQD